MCIVGNGGNNYNFKNHDYLYQRSPRWQKDLFNLFVVSVVALRIPTAAARLCPWRQDQD